MVRYRFQTDEVKRWLKAEGGYLVALVALLAFHGLSNWLWLSANETILGWDRPSHLEKTLIYNDILRSLDPRTLFVALTWQGYRPPLLFLTAVMLYRLLGVSSDVALMSNVPYWAILIFSVYGLGKRMYNRRVGLLAAYLVSTYPILFSLSRVFYVDFALAAMVALSLYLLVESDGFRARNWSLLFGVSLGLGMLVKWTYIAFVGLPFAYVLLRSGALKGVGSSLAARRSLSSFLSRLLASFWAHLALALLLTLAWYLPNLDRLVRRPWGLWIIPITWLLLAVTFFLLTRRAAQGANLLAALSLGVLVAGVWYLPNLGFVKTFYYIAYGGGGLSASKINLLHIRAYTYYLGSLFQEAMSPLYFLAFAVVLLISSRPLWEGRSVGKVLSRVRDNTWFLVIWLVASYLIFSLSFTRNPRYIAPLLAPVALITARGAGEVGRRSVRWGLIAFLLLGGLIQFFILSYDAFALVDELAWVDIPRVGSFSLLAEGVHIIRPNSGVTDSGYWVGPKILEFVDEQRGGEPTILGVLTRELQLNENTFRYLIHGEHPGVELWEINQIKDDLPVYPRLFACDYLVMKDGPNPRVSAETQRVMEKVLHDQGDYFHQVFREAQRYELPSEEVVYLYHREERLALEYDPEAYQALMRELESEEMEGDAIVLDSPSQMEIFGRYYEGGATFYPLPRSQPFDEGEVAQDLEEIVARHHRIYAIFWDEGGSGHYVEQWLKKNAYPALETWYGDARLLLYGASTEPGQEPLNAKFGEEILLTGYHLAREEVERGDILLLTLFWEAETRVSTDYKVFVHLLDEDGSILAQHDSQPMGGVRPTSGWRIGEGVEDHHGVLLPEVPPGEYRLVVGVYDPEGGERLPIADGGERAMGDSLLLGRVRVVSR